MGDRTGTLADALADRYRLGQLLGAGGMATVYLAQDLKHDRKVAIKVLRAELAAVIGADRFLAEIKTTANLQHPHILPLHDSGEANSYLFYVMPYVEGESLRDRLNREKQLPIADAVRIATEVASALDYAHRHGVIHRDIKPENILLHDGSALVADFGIALAASKASDNRMTETGMSLGTPHYMSPEQAMGEREIGPQSDVYALGAVTYEMLVGEPPFTGPTAQSIVAKVVTEEPRPLMPKRHTIPPQVEAAVLTALEKLPADRYHTAAQFAEALARPGVVITEATGSRPGGSTRRGVPLRMISFTVIAVALLALAAMVVSKRRAGDEPLTLRLAVQLPPGQTITTGIGTLLAISKDSRQLLYVGEAPNGHVQIWRRPLDSLAAMSIPGTVDAMSPGFSPDERSIAYFQAGASGVALKVAPLGGGPAITVGDSATPYGPAVWGPDGMLYYTRTGKLWRVGLTGSDPERVPMEDSTEAAAMHLMPSFLPGGQAILMTRAQGTELDVVSLSLGTGKINEIIKGAWAQYSESGHLIYLGTDGALLAIPFDPANSRLRGTPVPLLGEMKSLPTDIPDVVVSGNGTLVYLRATQQFVQPVWVSRSGLVEAIDSTLQVDLGSGRELASLALSPNGRRLVLARRSAEGTSSLLMYDMVRHTASRLTDDSLHGRRPAWTPDGRFVVFAGGNPTQSTILMRVPADGSEDPRSFLGTTNRRRFGPTWSKNGEWMAFIEADSGSTNHDIMYAGSGRDMAPRAILATSSRETDPALSPDGRWLAYTSAGEVYVQAFPASTGRWRVSSGGGSQPTWSHNGREIFFWAGAKQLVSVEFRASTGPGEHRTLADVRDFVDGNSGPSYAVSPNDDRLLMLQRSGGTRQLIIVTNWFEELRRRTVGAQR